MKHPTFLIAAAMTTAVTSAHAQAYYTSPLDPPTECNTQMVSILSNTPPTPRANFWPYYQSAEDKAMATLSTLTTPIAPCDYFELIRSMVVTMPPDIATAWDSFTLAYNEYRTSRHDEAMEWLSTCITGTDTEARIGDRRNGVWMRGEQIELDFARNRADCEVAVKRWSQRSALATASATVTGTGVSKTLTGTSVGGPSSTANAAAGTGMGYVAAAVLIAGAVGLASAL